MGDLRQHSFGDGSLLDLYGLMHATDAQATKVGLLTLGFAVAADNLSDSEFCHNRVLLLAVKNFTHRNTTESGNRISVSHACKSGDGGLHKVVRVG